MRALGLDGHGAGNARVSPGACLGTLAGDKGSGSVARRTARRGRLLRYCVRRARSRGTTASNAGAASTGRQALSGIQPTSCPDSAAPAEEPAL